MLPNSGKLRHLRTTQGDLRRFGKFDTIRDIITVGRGRRGRFLFRQLKEIPVRSRKFKTIGSRAAAGVSFSDNLRQFKPIWGNLRQFNPVGSRPIAGVAFSGNLRLFKSI